MNQWYSFLSGAQMFGAWLSGLYFLRFWYKTRDRLFLEFGAAFWLIAIERLVLAFMKVPATEDHSFIYLFRLAAFLLIIFAIVGKNRKNLSVE
jgi:hypothetical protein